MTPTVFRVGKMNTLLGFNHNHNLKLNKNPDFKTLKSMFFILKNGTLKSLKFELKNIVKDLKVYVFDIFELVDFKMLLKITENKKNSRIPSDSVKLKIEISGSKLRSFLVVVPVGATFHLTIPRFQLVFKGMGACPLSPLSRRTLLKSSVSHDSHRTGVTSVSPTLTKKFITEKAPSELFLIL